MKYLTIIVTLLSTLSDAHADDWEFILWTPDDPVVLASDGGRLYAGTGRGVYFSLDDGSSWRAGNLKRGVLAIGAGPDAVYAETWLRGVHRSDTGGNTWQTINRGLTVFDHDGDVAPFRSHIQQILVTSSGMVVAVGYHTGVYTSRDRGDIWHNISLDWNDIDIAASIFSIAEFDGYLWVGHSDSRAMRSADEGATWENIPYWREDSIAEFNRINDWAVLDNNLYVAGRDGFGRWREDDLKWDNLRHGLPTTPYLDHLAVHRGRIFAGSRFHGIWMFDAGFETWRSAGLQDSGITGLVSHGSYLYAGTREGIYRASVSIVQPHGKAATTWGALKTE